MAPNPGLFQHHTGRIIVRLAPPIVTQLRTRVQNAQPDFVDLPGLAAGLGLPELTNVLAAAPLPTRALVQMPAAEILQLEASAGQSSYPPRYSLTAYWLIDSRSLSIPARLALAGALAQLPQVELVYFERGLVDPVVPSGANPDEPNQEYLRAAPEGIDAEFAWSIGLDGSGIDFVDVERNWNWDHVDLKALGLSDASLLVNVRDPNASDHGTSVLGIVAAVDNDLGGLGISPSIRSIKVSSRYTATGEEWDVETAIAKAAATVPHVLLIEVATKGNYPVEVTDACFDAIRTAVGNGITVIEAAGNAGDDLEKAGWLSVLDLGVRRTDRTIPARMTALGRGDPATDSGAVLVAAGSSVVGTNGGHARSPSSNYGTRIDCYAWGDSVFTTGDKFRFGAAVDDTAYRDDFDGTSAASAIVAGAAVLLHQAYATAYGVRLQPGQARALLADSSGTPHEGPDPIGVMPNLRALAAKLGLVPDVFVRDSLVDIGDEPGAGAGQSPDIFVLDPSAALPTDPTIDGGDRLVIPNAVNHVIVRAWNRAIQATTATRAKVYWSEPSTMLAPAYWHELGWSGVTAVPGMGNLLLPPIVWNTSGGNGPAGDHGCFVAVLDDPIDPAPPLPTSFGAPTDFMDFVNAHNSVAWRNFTVVSVSASSAIVWLHAVEIRGLPERVHPYEVMIRTTLRPEVPIWLRIIERRGDPDRGLTVLPRNDELHAWRVPSEGRVRLRLGREFAYRCQFGIEIGRRLERTERLAVIQAYNGVEVGRYTWILRPPTVD